ncbi:hypothetical protein OH76DRAFT_260965 [Lentinus brumalis]|uniref:Uncharacterized protein n=1 Tax=Lentinus brumalis TaxID=2498619 RepID=A0A371DGG2_9APHY|nr:hypothetical protein OH76DRAFT_260965 [Polyporus brumalis]
MCGQPRAIVPRFPRWPLGVAHGRHNGVSFAFVIAQFCSRNLSPPHARLALYLTSRSRTDPRLSATQPALGEKPDGSAWSRDVAAHRCSAGDDGSPVYMDVSVARVRTTWSRRTSTSRGVLARYAADPSACPSCDAYSERRGRCSTGSARPGERWANDGDWPTSRLILSLASEYARRVPDPPGDVTERRTRACSLLDVGTASSDRGDGRRR